jgi:hypothetical protein
MTIYVRIYECGNEATLQSVYIFHINSEKHKKKLRKDKYRFLHTFSCLFFAKYLSRIIFFIEVTEFKEKCQEGKAGF